MFKTDIIPFKSLYKLFNRPAYEYIYQVENSNLKIFVTFNQVLMKCSYRTK